MILIHYGLGLFVNTIILFFKDSVLVIPEESYSPDLLNPKAMDKASDFINQCGAQGFHIQYVYTHFLVTELCFCISFSHSRMLRSTPRQRLGTFCSQS